MSGEKWVKAHRALLPNVSVSCRESEGISGWTRGGVDISAFIRTWQWLVDCLKSILFPLWSRTCCLCVHVGTQEVAPISHVVPFFKKKKVAIVILPLYCHFPSLSSPKWIKWIRNTSRSHTNSIAWILSNPRWIDSENEEQQHCNWDAWTTLNSSSTPTQWHVLYITWKVHLIGYMVWKANGNIFGLELLGPDILCKNCKSLGFPQIQLLWTVIAMNLLVAGILHQKSFQYQIFTACNLEWWLWKVCILLLHSGAAVVRLHSQ